ncbi:acetaldehyde dehydrogenase (acetylating) [Staphylococcus sp. NAM3COL9]|uniref:acetaldehyde dehydrogenase (acetylating) n=1 Tax=Staphylococcus sp. NAM3COL9 TaxID=1667172 RepID=UPI00071067D0|nr:acetaldehyde dehydrogenase (acetylating) [Staphylococcus sp. NAM3COL9]KRG11022.1 acetaldehyde dehydrogenase [Staphylococcus sp. NAM3COL9]
MANEKIKCAIIGSGNIGTDLMIKLLRSDILEVTALIGIDPESKGLKRAEENGLTAISNGIDGLIERPELADIVYEATSAKAHLHNAKVLKKLGKKAIDLTPAAVGPFLVPSVNLKEDEIPKLDNVNMVTCGGQATIPMVKAVSNVLEVDYAEIVASISSKSAGPGTRQNIDEFTMTTANALKEVGGAKESKAIITLNPADPPILMRNTIHIQTAGDAEMKREEIQKSLDQMQASVQAYVSGYRFKADPVIKGKIITISVEVEGNGDFLPEYAGNLDIITSAAVKTGEVMAESILKERVTE